MTTSTANCPQRCQFGEQTSASTLYFETTFVSQNNEDSPAQCNTDPATAALSCFIGLNGAANVDTILYVCGAGTDGLQIGPDVPTGCSDITLTALFQ